MEILAKHDTNVHRNVRHQERSLNQNINDMVEMKQANQTIMQMHDELVRFMGTFKSHMMKAKSADARTSDALMAFLLAYAPYRTL
uniref:Uncharacterized protein n=1 Tax=Acrobeloides nanus TaxID=290746 RepID=A0A914D9H3_9BILA